MSYTLFPLTLFDDGWPVDSGIYRDVVREDLTVLKAQPPKCSPSPIQNGRPQSTVSTFTAASTLLRTPRIRVRPSSFPMVLRTLRFSLFVAVSNALATGTFRCWVGRRFRVPSAVAEGDFTVVTGTTTSTAGEWIEIDVPVHVDRTVRSVDGMEAGEVAVPYRFTYAGIQATVTVGHTVYLDDETIEEKDPA